MSTAIRQVLDLLDPPVWIVTSCREETAGGFVATFVMKASIVVDEPRMIAGVAKHHFTHRLIESSGRMALHLVAADDVDSVVHFGLQSGHEGNKFPWQGVVGADSNPPELPTSAGHLMAEVETQLDIGDRTLFVCRIVDGCPGNSRDVMTMSRLIPQLTEGQLEILQSRLQTDSDLDRQAIQEWRQQNGIDTSAR